MERVKRRKLKFPCLFGVNDKTPRGKPIQSWCPSDATTDNSLLKFQVGKHTSKQSNQNRKRSSSILAKLMGKNGISSARPMIKKKQIIKLNSNEVSESNLDIPPKKVIILKQNNMECFSSDSEEIKIEPSRITFGLNDRLTHSLSNISEASLITEAENKMSKKLKMSVSKDHKLGDMISFSDKSTSSSTSILPSFQEPNHETSYCHEDDVDEKIVVYSEPFNKRERLKGVFDHGDDIIVKKGRFSQRSQLFQKSTQSYFENDGATYAASSVDEVGGYKIEMSSENSQEPLNAKSGGTTPLLLSGRYVSSRFNHFETVDAQVQELKKQLHLLKIESLLNSKRHTLTRNRNHHGQQPSVTTSPTPNAWESSFFAHILQSSDIYETDPDIIHHPRDPRLFYHIEKCYFEGANLSKSEKHLLYDYIEQTFIKISKSMLTNSLVNPKEEESQLILSELSIEDQVVMVVEEIDKEDTEVFIVNKYEKDPKWLQSNQINNLGNLLSELVLTDLVIEVITS